MPLAAIALLLFAALAGPARGVSVDGRLTTSIYTYESGASDTTTATAVRAYQGLRLDLAGLGVPGLSLHTYLQGTTDLAEQADSDPRLRLYHAYLGWQHRQVRLQAGRQQVQAGVGYGTIDGLRGEASLTGVNLSLYAGLLVPLDKPTHLGSWADGHLWGARLRTDRLPGLDLALSFADHLRQPPAYASPGRYSLQLEPPAVERRLVGLDVEHRFAQGHRLYGRLDYDLRDQRLRRSELSGQYIFNPRLNAQVEWFRRAPAVFANSLLSVFPQQDYQEISGRVNYQINPAMQLSASAATLLYDGDKAQRFGLTASFGERYRIGYYRSAGYAGASDGLVGSACYSFNRQLALSGELDLTAVDEEADEREGLLNGSVGLSYQPTRAALLEAELQGLRNPTYTSDLRVLLRGSWHFFKGER